MLIVKADEEDKKAEKLDDREFIKTIHKVSSVGSVADELFKLNELLKTEVITREEFEQQKKMLLAN